VHLLRAGDRSQARAAFTGAAEVYAFLGAAADVARLEAAFRAHGIRRGPHSKHRQARNGWDSLTPTEIKIAALVAKGLSNPDIAVRLVLSRRTVATHVSHILRKLDVHTRTDIARESALRTFAPRLKTHPAAPQPLPRPLRGAPATRPGPVCPPRGFLCNDLAALPSRYSR